MLLLFQVNNIQFMVEASEMPRNSTTEKCPIELQIETANGIVDTVCEKATKKGYAGLCSIHYSEYLVFSIRKANLETLSILTVHNCQELLRFQGIVIPTQSSVQSDNEYKDVCQKVRKTKIICKNCNSKIDIYFQLVKNNIALQ